MPSTSRARVASGSVKLPSPQNQSITRSSVLHVQQPQRARHQHAVDVRVDLGEVGRLERHGDAELGQRVSQLRAALVQQAAPCPAPWAAATTARRDGRCAKARSLARSPSLSGSRWRSTSAVTSSPQASSICGQVSMASMRADQLAQRQQQVAHVRRHDVAFADVGDVAALALVKADQHRALLAHVAHRKARAPAVAPGRALRSGRSTVSGLHLAQVPQVVLQHALLDRHLGADVQVLHLAAAAGALVQAEVRAARAHALRRLPVDRRQRGLLPVVLLAVDLGGHPLERQRAFDEHHLAVGPAGHALRVDVERVHFQPALGQGGLVFNLFRHASIVSGAYFCRRETWNPHLHRCDDLERALLLRRAGCAGSGWRLGELLARSPSTAGQPRLAPWATIPARDFAPLDAGHLISCHGLSGERWRGRCWSGRSGALGRMANLATVRPRLTC